LTARRRFARAARVALFAAAGLVVLLVLLLLLGLRTSFAREQIRVRVNAALSELFQGRVQIDRIGAVTLGGVSGVDAHVFDANRNQVIHVQGLSAAAALPSLAWQLLAHGDQPELVLTVVHVDHADVTLRDDAELGVSLASTFLPRSPTPTPKGAPPSGPHLRVERLSFDHIWAHGLIGSSPPLDAEIKQLSAALNQTPQAGFSLDLKHLELVARNLPGGVEPRGQVTGKIVAPADAAAGPLRLEGTFAGRAAGSPVTLAASWIGDDLHAQVHVPELPAAFVNQQLPALRLDGTVAVHAQLDGALPVLNFAATVDGTAAHVVANGYAAVAQGFEAAVALEATGIDAARVVADAPRSELQLELRAFAFEADDGDFIGCHRLDVAPGQLAQQATPSLWVNGRGRWDAAGKLSGSGQLGIEDPGLTLRGRYHLALPAGNGGVVGAALEAELNDPQRLAAMGLHAAGHGEASAEVQLNGGNVAGKATLSLRHLDHTVVQARNVELAARASGTLDQPQLHAAATLDVLSGRAHADLDYSKARQELELFVSDLDLIRLSIILGSKLPLEQATLGATAHVSHQSSSAHYQVDARAHLQLGKLGSAQLTASQLELPTTLSRRSGWADLKGELAVDGKLQLESLSPFLTRAGLPIERTTGTVHFEVAAKHAAADAQGLELSAAVDTFGLRVVQQRQVPRVIATTADAIASEPLALEGIDLHFSAHARPLTGEAFGTLILRDPQGTLADLQAATQLPETWPSGLDASTLMRLPLKAHLEMAQRRLGGLPPLLRPDGLRGRVSVEADFEGNLAEPQLVAQLSLQALRTSGSKQGVDVDAKLRYTPERGECRVEAKLADQSSRLANVNATWQGDLRRAGLLASGNSGLVASADIELAEFPLELVPLVADRQITGRVTGKLGVKSWGQDAQLNAALTSTTLSLDKMPIRELSASAQTRGDQLRAEVTLKVGSGTLQGSLESDVRWGKRPLPELQHRGTAKLATHAFDLASLSPLLAGYVSEIGGMLDANGQLAVTPTTTELSGSAKLEKGVLQLPALGQRLSEITARVAVAGQKLKLEELTARGTTGRVTGKGSASLDGFDLRAAEAHLTIPVREPLPLTLEGAALGDVSGSVDATFTNPARGERKLDIDVPVLHLVTPDSSGYDLQSLDAPPDIRVGVRRADGTFIALPVQPLTPGAATGDSADASAPLRMRIRLGKDVRVERGSTAQVQLGGELQIVTGADTAVDGRIEVRGGKLDVSGKTFEIERGVVAFEGNDPGNPTITATARWDAPGYTVYADYVGDVKNGRIKLRSEPPLTPSEIANLLLFGTPEGSSGGSADANGTALAVGVAGDTAAKGLNQVLDDFTKLDVSARIDTTTGSARPELVFQVSPRVSARVSRAIGAPAAGEALDRTFLTLELRLRRAWALSAVFGDHGGSALDLIWRRRY
jgi:autotransporter translocation and assembly factor TamB